MAEMDAPGINRTDVDAALAAGAAIADAKMVPGGSIPYLVAPEGYHLVSLEGYQTTPLRTKGSVAMLDAASLIDYVKEFAQEGSTRLFGDSISQSIVAIIDYHRKDQAAWSEHRVSYACPKTTEWITWIKQSGVKMTQAEFARFIEDNLVDVIQPTGADLLTVARTLEAKKNVNFSSSLRLDNGETQFLFEEEIKGSAAKGTLEIPEIFILGLKPFEGGPAYRMEARLRYRIDQGKLTFWYDLLRPHKVLEDAFSQLIAHVEASTGMKVWRARV